jgi:hypothetical protein
LIPIISRHNNILAFKKWVHTWLPSPMDTI